METIERLFFGREDRKVHILTLRRVWVLLAGAAAVLLLMISPTGEASGLDMRSTGEYTEAGAAREPSPAAGVTAATGGAGASAEAESLPPLESAGVKPLPRPEPPGQASFPQPEGAGSAAIPPLVVPGSASFPLFGGGTSQLMPSEASGAQSLQPIESVEALFTPPEGAGSAAAPPLESPGPVSFPLIGGGPSQLTPQETTGDNAAVGGAGAGTETLTPPEASESTSLTPPESAGSYIWPTEGALTSYFGQRSATVGSTNHMGIDIGGNYGQPIYAADAGEVIESRISSSYGYVIRIMHDNGDVTLYCHCSALLVSVGERVGRGQDIARMGSTGVASGVHLHFELMIDGVNVDPLRYLPDDGDSQTS